MGPYPIGDPPMLNNNPADVLAAAPDAIAMALGEHVANPHPLAHDLAHAPLSSLAAACAAKAQRPGSMVKASWHTSQDFGVLLSAGVQEVINRRFRAQAEHRRFCGELTLRNFKPVELPEIDLSDELPVVGELDEFGATYVGQPAQVRVDEVLRDVRICAFGRLINISRQAVINDDIGLVADMVAQMGNAIARTEAKLLYQELEINPVLMDSDRVFLTGFNKLADALSETSLASGVAMMRKFKTKAGNDADLAARHLVVAAELELLARKLVHECNLPIEVTASARLPAQRWYLFSDPEQHAACAVLKLAGQRSVVLVEPIKNIAIEGVAIRPRADLGAVIKGRMGSIRGGAD